MNSEIKIIDNYLPEVKINYLENLLLSDNFPYYYTINIAGENSKITDTFMFNHNLIRENKEVSTVGNIITNMIMYDVSHNYIYRSKINFYLKSHRLKKHKFHLDNSNLDIKIALFYVNTNNGYTEFEDKTIVKSVRNRLVMFNGNLKHRSTTTTDTRHRINININYN